MAKQKMHYRRGTATFSSALCGAIVEAVQCSPVPSGISCRSCFTRYHRGLGAPASAPASAPAPSTAIVHYGVVQRAQATPTLCSAVASAKCCTTQAGRVTCEQCVAHPLLALARLALVLASNSSDRDR